MPAEAEVGAPGAGRWPAAAGWDARRPDQPAWRARRTEVSGPRTEDRGLRTETSPEAGDDGRRREGCGRPETGESAGAGVRCHGDAEEETGGRRWLARGRGPDAGGACVVAEERQRVGADTAVPWEGG